jgi:hypothetical protein
MFNRDDLFQPIFPAFIPASDRNSLNVFLQNLQQSLFHNVLGPEDVTVAYGSNNNRLKIPAYAEVSLPPDEEWIDLLNTPCSHEHD